MRVCVTGGAGYVGAPAVEELLAAGHEVTVLDSLIHRQHGVAAKLAASGARVVHGDVRDGAARLAALAGADAIAHLAAIVGDPACAREPARSFAVNVAASRALARDPATRGVRPPLIATTSANYRRTAGPTPLHQK